MVVLQWCSIVYLLWDRMGEWVGESGEEGSEGRTRGGEGRGNPREGHGRVQSARVSNYMEIYTQPSVCLFVVLA